MKKGTTHRKMRVVVSTHGGVMLLMRKYIFEGSDELLKLDGIELHKYLTKLASEIEMSTESGLKNEMLSKVVSKERERLDGIIKNILDGKEITVKIPSYTSHKYNTIAKHSRDKYLKFEKGVNNILTISKLMINEITAKLIKNIMRKVISIDSDSIKSRKELLSTLSKPQIIKFMTIRDENNKLYTNYSSEIYTKPLLLIYKDHEKSIINDIISKRNINNITDYTNPKLKLDEINLFIIKKNRIYSQKLNMGSNMIKKFTVSYVIKESIITVSLSINKQIYKIICTHKKIKSENELREYELHNLPEFGITMFYSGINIIKEFENKNINLLYFRYKEITAGEDYDIVCRCALAFIYKTQLGLQEVKYDEEKSFEDYLGVKKKLNIKSDHELNNINYKTEKSVISVTESINIDEIKNIKNIKFFDYSPFRFLKLARIKKNPEVKKNSSKPRDGYIKYIHRNGWFFHDILIEDVKDSQIDMDKKQIKPKIYREDFDSIETKEYKMYKYKEIQYVKIHKKTTKKIYDFDKCRSIAMHSFDVIKKAFFKINNIDGYIKKLKEEKIHMDKFTEDNIHGIVNLTRVYNERYRDVLTNVLKITKTPIFKKIIDFEKDISYLKYLIIKPDIKNGNADVDGAIYNIFKMNIILYQISEAIVSIEKNEFDSYSNIIIDNINSKDEDIKNIAYSMAIFTSKPTEEELETSLDYLNEIKDSLDDVLKAKSLAKYKKYFIKFLDNIILKFDEIKGDIIDAEKVKGDGNMFINF